MNFADEELNEMLRAWNVAVPSDKLRARIFDSVGMPAYAVPVKPEMAWYRNLNMSLGLLIQCALVASLFAFFQPAAQQSSHKPQNASMILLNGYQPERPAASKAHGGGGGGQRDRTPVARGAAPRFALKQFIPPMVAVARPELPVVPTLTAAAPEVQAAIYADPLSQLAGTSGGAGINGFGDGQGGGIGQGSGDGIGDGEGGGSGGAIYRAGGNVSSPILVSKVEPEYSEEARRAKYSGVVHLSVVIDEYGVPTDVHVTGPLGLGLDEKAIEAVQHWRFRPGRRNGKPVKVRAFIEVSFRLL